MLVQIVGEEKHTENRKHDEEFHEYDEPQHPSDGHALETIYIESPDFEEPCSHLHIRDKG
jgi:hypothetical protein